MISIAQLHQDIAANLRPPASGDLLQVYETLPSTNIIAKELAAKGAPQGTAVLAWRQEAGQGRFRKSFYSPPGGIYLSLVLQQAELALSSPALLTITAAVAVSEAIAELCGKELAIKWVNDLLYSGKKVCGISCDTGSAPPAEGSLSWFVLGIGINFSLDESQLPLELQGVVGSLYDPRTVCQVTRTRLVAEVINRTLSYCSTQVATETLLSKYRQRLLTLGQEINVIQPTESYPALAVDLGAQGELIVRLANGELRSLNSGEVSTRIISGR